MKTIYAKGVIGLMIVLLVAAQCGGPPVAEVPAEDNAGVAVPDITILEPVARASIPNGAVYMRLVNKGRAADRLVGAETDVAEAAELHETRLAENDVMQMGPLDSVEVPARGSAVLEPGGRHIMLIGLHRELATGDTFELTLNFEQSGPQTIEVEVTDAMAFDHSRMGHDMKAGETEHDLDQSTR